MTLNFLDLHNACIRYSLCVLVSTAISSKQRKGGATVHAEIMILLLRCYGYHIGSVHAGSALHSVSMAAMKSRHSFSLFNTVCVSPAPSFHLSFSACVAYAGHGVRAGIASSVTTADRMTPQDWVTGLE